VEGETAAVGAARAQPALANELVEQLRDVHHLEGIGTPEQVRPFSAARLLGCAKAP
jgi:hypothetical protein